MDEGRGIYSVAMFQEKKLPILSEISNEKKLVPAVPDKNIVKKMYRMSGDARSFQYLIDKNVVRRWEDSLLCMGDRRDTLNTGNHRMIGTEEITQDTGTSFDNMTELEK